MTKAYSYIRFSTPEQSKGDSYRRQSEKARAYARDNGLDLDETVTFEDLGVSAFHGSNSRTGALSAFLQALQTGAIARDSYLLVESLDRISRQDILEAQATFMLIISKGVSLVTLGDGKVYQRETINQNPVDLILSIVILMRSNEESRTKSLRGRASWTAKRATAVADHTPMTTRVPSWLKVDKRKQSFTIIEPRAEVVRLIYRMAAEGHGLTAIAKHLNETGVETWGRSQAWGRSFVLKLLHSPAPIGHFTPHETAVDANGNKTREPLEEIQGYFPAIIDLKLWEQGRKVASLQTRGSWDVSYSLAGLTHCAACGGRLTRKSFGSNPKSGVPRLVHSRSVATGIPSPCSSPTIPVDLLETALRHSAVELTDLGAQTTDDGLRVKLAQAEAELSASLDNLEVVSVIASGPGGREALRVAQAVYAEAQRLRDTVASQVDAATSPVFLQDLLTLRRSLVDQAPPAEVNRLFRSLLTRVEVDWSGTCIDFHWRNGGFTTVSLGNEFDPQHDREGRPRAS